MAQVISKDVRCPWCGAEPGEDCTTGSFDPPYVRQVPYGRAHLARLKEVEDVAKP